MRAKTCSRNSANPGSAVIFAAAYDDGFMSVIGIPFTYMGRRFAVHNFGPDEFVVSDMATGSQVPESRASSAEGAMRAALENLALVGREFVTALYGALGRQRHDDEILDVRQASALIETIFRKAIGDSRSGV